MEYFAGLDISMKETHICVVDHEGGIVLDPARSALRTTGLNQITLFSADVRDQTSVAASVVGADSVVNAVSAYVEKSGVTFEAVHERGAEMVAREAASAGVARLVLVSGIGADPKSGSPYIRARGRGEPRLDPSAGRSGTRSTILGKTIRKAWRKPNLAILTAAINAVVPRHRQPRFGDRPECLRVGRSGQRTTVCSDVARLTRQVGDEPLSALSLR